MTVTLSMLTRGELPSIRIGSQIRVPAYKLREWVDQKVREQVRPPQTTQEG